MRPLKKIYLVLIVAYGMMFSMFVAPLTIYGKFELAWYWCFLVVPLGSLCLGTFLLEKLGFRTFGNLTHYDG